MIAWKCLNASRRFQTWYGEWLWDILEVTWIWGWKVKGQGLISIKRILLIISSLFTAHLDQFVPDRSSAVCLSRWNAVGAGVHQVWGAAGLRPRAPAIRVVHRRSRAADRWSLITVCVCILICMQMTLRLMAGPHRLMPARSKPICRSASTTLRGGRLATGSSWTRRRQSLFGALLSFPMETYKSATTQFIQSSQPETSVCTSTVAWQWGLTSIMYCRHATVHWDRSDLSCRLCHHTR